MEKRYSFKRLFWSYTFCALPFLLLAGMLALFNLMPIYFNDTPRYGIQGLMIAILFIPFFGLMFGIFNWLALTFGGFFYDLSIKLIKKK